MNRRLALSSRSVNRCRPRVLTLERRVLLSGVNVTQYHNDTSLTGDNLDETVLTPSNVNPTDFGLLFSQPVDGYVYAEPLYMSGLTIDGAVHNVVFIATENDTVYAFDADSDAGADAKPLWVHSFIDPSTGITPVPYADTETHDIVPVIGITGTPVIDPATDTLYVVTTTKEIINGDTSHPNYVQTLHALDVTTGADKFVNDGYVIGDTVRNPDGSYSNNTAITSPGTGVDSTDGVISFNAERENQRAALQLDGNWILVSWASHGDNGPYHGWMVAFDKTTLQPVGIFDTSPNGSESGIWESGDPAAVDPETGAIYIATGNGTFDEYGSTPDNDYGESVVRLSPTLVDGQFVVQDFFTPYNFQTLNNNDADLGSGGTLILPDSVGSAAHPHLLVETGKSGKIYLIDRDDMGKIANPGTGPDDVVQVVTAGQAGVWGSPTFLQINSTTGIIYYHGSGDVLKGYYISNGHIENGSLPGDHAILTGNYTAGFPGTQPVISADGTADPTDPANAIVWELQVDQYGTSGPAILRAYDPTDLQTEYYDSSESGERDQLGGAVKFAVPTVADGHVYVGTQYQFSVFGLFPQSTAAPATPTKLTASASLQNSIEIQLNWTNPTPAAGAAATGIEILRSTNGGNFTQISTVSASATSFTDQGPLTTGVVYGYELVAVNQAGSSAASATAKVDLTSEPPVLTITNVTASAISLSWSAVANSQYVIEQSTDGVNFTTIATVPASQTSYIVTGLAPGIYAYQIGAASVNPTQSSVSNVQGATIGGVINQSGGFINTSALTVNGSAQFAEQVARITNADQQTGSVFTNNRITIDSFTTSFEIRLHEGTQPDYADGITFVIQTGSPTALGLGLVGMGYENIGNSIAIKLDTFQNPGDPSDSSTGLYENGATPSGGVDTTANGLLVNSQDTKLVTLTYNGTTLTETITDTLDASDTFTTSYKVNIPAVIGSDTAYVGFTGSTGDSDYWELQDVTSWTFTSTEPLPGAPTNLQAARSSASEIDLSWTSNSYNETGFAIERSTDGVNFTQIGTTTNTTYQDTTAGAGPYQYRVVAYNANGNSPYSNTAVVQTTPTVIWDAPASITYGTALGASQLDATASVPGTFTYTPAAGTVLHAGENEPLSVLFTPTDATDYTTASATTKINVSQATPTITWTSPASITYGAGLGSTQLDASASVAGTYAYTPASGTVLNAGNNQTLSVLFTPNDATDYTTASATTKINVLQATPTITWTSPASITYGTGLGSTQLDASASVAGTYAYTPASGTVLHAGNNQTLSVLFTPNDATDYTTASATTKINVLQATPTITWTSPASITYGTGLGSTQLDASASVAGTYAYTPASGTVLHAGKNQALSVTFTPTDTTDYTGASGTTTITVLQATPTITWKSPAPITYGTALGSTQLDASAPVAGTYAYTPASGTVLHAGKNQMLSVLFTPTDAVDYVRNSASTSIDVAQAPLTIAVNNQTMTYGGAVPPLTVSYTGLLNGDTPAVFHAAGNSAPSFSSVLPNLHAGSYPLNASGASDDDYNITYLPGTLTVTPAPLTITANDAAMFAGQVVPALTASYSGLENGDTPASLGSPPVVSTAATSASPAGVYAITVGGATSTDYTITYVNGLLTVNPALVTLTRVSIKRQLVTTNKSVQVIVLQFSGGLNAADASLLHNYTLATVPQGKKQKSKNVALLRAKYKVSNNTVTLRTVKTLSVRTPLQLTIKSPGLLDALGRPLGGSLVATLSKKGGMVAGEVRPARASVPAAPAVDALLARGFQLKF